MRALRCLVGVHKWRIHRLPDVGGKAAVYELCERCGRERTRYDPGNPTLGADAT